MRDAKDGGWVVVDAGAHIGTHALPLSRVVGPSGRVYAIEAQHEGRLVTDLMVSDLRMAGFMVPATAGLSSVDGGANVGLVEAHDLRHEQG